MIAPDTRLWQVLQRHCGRAHAIRARDIAAVLGLKNGDANRIIQNSVSALIDTGYPIGAVTENGATAAGYFVIETQEELDEAVAQLRGRARELERRIDALNSAYHRGLKQPTLFAIPIAAAPDLLTSGTAEAVAVKKAPARTPTA